MVGLRQQLIWLVDARGLTEKEFKLVGLLTSSTVVKSQLFHFPLSHLFSTNQNFESNLLCGLHSDTKRENCEL
jgi:hypothetical protein